MKNQTDPKSIKVNVRPDRLEAKYSDFSIVSHSQFGFHLDFGQRLPQAKVVEIVSRVAMSPLHAKSLLKNLEVHIGKYEEKFGEIKLNDGKTEGESEEGRIIHFKK